MKKRILFCVLGLCLFFVMSLIFYHPVVYSKYDFLPVMDSYPEDGIDVIKTKEMAFKVAKQVWIEKYGYLSITCMIFDCRLKDNRYWIIEGRNVFHRLFKMCGGGPYIIIEKNGKVISLGHTG